MTGSSGRGSPDDDDCLSIRDGPAVYTLTAAAAAAAAAKNTFVHQKHVGMSAKESDGKSDTEFCNSVIQKWL